MNTIDINNPDAIKEYLDNAIVRWRNRREVATNRMEELKQNDNWGGDQYTNSEEDLLIATCYIDAFQSVRVSLFSELLV